MKTATGPMDDEPRKTSGSLPIPRSKRGLKGFLSEVRRELDKVSWPTKPETNRLTGVVLALCVLIVALLTSMSTVADTLVRLITTGR